MSTPLQRDLVRAKVARRLLPYVFLLYIISYLDRANVAFAKLKMAKDLQFSEDVFGFGIGIFFLGYIVLEIPGALLVERWSARKWISRILVTWGMCTVWIGFIDTPREFYTARFFLGLAEAGFFPGIIVYLTHWFPAKERAKALSGLVIAIPVSMMIGSPLSAWMMELNWLNWAGWRWLFVLQGVPAIVLGLVTLFYLTDHPKDAKWLTEEEKNLLTSELDEEKKARSLAHGHHSIFQGLTQSRVWLLGTGLFLVNIGIYSFTFWLPTLIQKSGGLEAAQAARYSFIPFSFAFLCILWGGWSSDRTQERKWHTVIPMILAGLLFSITAFVQEPFALVLALLCLTAGACYAWPPSFWILPTMTLGASAAAASIGLINSMGNLGGFVGPVIVGKLKTRNMEESTSVLFLATCFILAGIVITFLKFNKTTTQTENKLSLEAESMHLK